MQALTRQVRRSLPTHSRTHSLTHKRFVSFNVKETLTTMGPVVNATAELEHSFTQENVNDFATLCGDNNPIHLDAEFASTTRFKAPIVHGVLVSGLISTLFGRVMDGSIYVKQTLNFKNPVHVNAKVRVRMEVIRVDDKRIGKLLTCSTEVTLPEQGNIAAIKGESIVLIPK